MYAWKLAKNQARKYARKLARNQARMYRKVVIRTSQDTLQKEQKVTAQ